MPSSTTFTGTGFRLQSVAPRTGYAMVRVRYTNDPLAANPAGANDGTNPLNYSLTGPQAMTITGASVVPDDPQSIDLLLGAPLVSGTWVLSVSNVQTVTADALTPPTSLSFDVDVAAGTEDVSMGAENDSAESVLRKHLNPSMVGRFWDGIIAGLAVGDRLNWDNAKLAFDQLFKISASGRYLEERAADDGIIKPAAVGMGDDLFRQYAIKITSQKITPQVLYEILEVFYGSDATRAYSTTSGSQPFALADEDSLTVILDGKDSVEIVFREADFAQISQATAIEVAAAITRVFRQLGLKAFAVAFDDPESGTKKVRIYSASLGLAGSVRVTLGKAQNVLKFPDVILSQVVAGAATEGVQTAQNWAVTIPSAEKMRLTLSGVTNVDLNKVRVGDYVNVYGTNFATNNRGSFPILSVDVRYVGATLTQYVEVANPTVTAQGSVTIAAASDLLFFRPTRSTISTTRTVVVAQAEPGVLNVVLPATTLAVERTAKTGAYMQQRVSQTPTSVERLPSGSMTLNFGAAHGLQVGNHLILDGVVPNTSVPATTAGNGTTTTDANPVSFTSSLANLPANVHNLEACLLADGLTVFAQGGFYILAGVDQGCVNEVSKFQISGSSVLATGGIQYTYAATDPTDGTAVEYHRLSLLTDVNQGGNVLSAGGFDGTNTVTGSYIFNTGAGTWSSVINLATARAKHTQTVLSDGRVLAAGGASNVSTSLSSCELFTPSAGGGSWGAAASMSLARTDAQALKLSDGRVLVIGGRQMTGSSAWDPDGGAEWGTLLASCEIYDPSLNTWTRTGDMALGRCLHKAVLLPDDQVLVFGGRTVSVTQPDTEGYSAQAEIWDAKTGRWSPAGSAHTGRQWHELVYSASTRKAVLLGGFNASGAVSKIEYFDAVTRTWSRAPVPLANARQRGAAVALSNGSVWYGGGILDAATTSTNTQVLFIPNSNALNARAATGSYKVTAVPSPTSLTVSTAERSYTKAVNSALRMTPATAVPATTIPGPYIFDPDEGVGITGKSSTTTQDLNASQQYRTLKVADATQFPDEEGYVSIAFGSKLQVQPVRYLSRLSTTELVLDFTFKFPVTIPSGATVTLLEGKAPFVPENPEEVGSFYLTASSAGRVAAEAAIDACVAAGLTVNKTVLYPGDRGLGGEGLPSEGADKLSDKVMVWGGDDVDAEIQSAREGEE